VYLRNVKAELIKRCRGRIDSLVNNPHNYAKDQNFADLFSVIIFQITSSNIDISTL